MCPLQSLVHVKGREMRYLAKGSRKENETVGLKALCQVDVQKIKIIQEVYNLTIYLRRALSG